MRISLPSAILNSDWPSAPPEPSRILEKVGKSSKGDEIGLIEERE